MIRLVLSQAGRTISLVILVCLAAGLTARGQDRPPPPAPGQAAPTIDPRYYNLVRRFIEQTRQDIEAVHPDLDRQALRGRLLVEALQVVNETLDHPLPEDDLLFLPESLKRDAARLVDAVLGTDREPVPDETQESREDTTDEAPPPPIVPSPEPRDVELPEAMRPFEPIITDFLSELNEELARQQTSDPDRRDRLEQAALEVTAQALASGSPDDLSPAHREAALHLADRVFQGDQTATLSEQEQALQNDLDALDELLRRKNTELEEQDGIADVDERTDRLEAFGLQTIREALHRRDPDATIPDDARNRIAFMARLAAQDIPIRPTEPSTTEPGPDVQPEVTGIDRTVIDAVASLARAVDQALVGLGLDSNIRRQTLRKFVLERIASKTGASGIDALSESVRSEAERIVEQILGASGTGTRIIGVQPPVVTIPSTMQPTSVVPTYILVPRHCLPWFSKWR